MALDEQSQKMLELLMDTPLYRFEELYEQLRQDGTAWETFEYYNQVAQKAVLLGEYIESRCYGHDAAKLAIKTLNKVRKAMGYTYPSALTSFQEKEKSNGMA